GAARLGQSNLHSPAIDIRRETTGRAGQSGDGDFNGVALAGMKRHRRDALGIAVLGPAVRLGVGKRLLARGNGGERLVPPPPPAEPPPPPRAPPCQRSWPRRRPRPSASCTPAPAPPRRAAVSRVARASG